MLISRTAESSSKETQKDVHCENGRDEEPVEEYCCAVRQLVSVCHMYCCLESSLDISVFKVLMCVGASEPEKGGGGGGGGNACECL